MKSNTYTLSLVFISILTLFLYACSSTQVDNDSPADKQFSEGERLLKKGKYLEAIERFQVLKTRYPYSIYAPTATLHIADAYYEQESYIEAASSYKVFRELYPRHEKSDYALFRLAESYTQDTPDSVDRDLSNAQLAIDAYEELLNKFPSSPYVKGGEDEIHKLKVKLAEKEDYVGNYYFIRDYYQSAANRYSYLLEKFSGLGLDEKAMYRLAFSYEKIGEYTKAKELLEQMGLQFPNGQFKSQIKSLAKKLSKEKESLE